MKITELDSNHLRKAIGNAELETYQKHYRAIDEVISYDFAKSEIMKVVNAFNLGVAIGKNQERAKRREAAELTHQLHSDIEPLLAEMRIE